MYLAGKQTPVFFGSAVNNFGIDHILNDFAVHAPSPQPRKTQTRFVLPEEPHFSGIVFKIQANMDPNHRDRIAFLRICSGHYQKGMKLYNVRTAKFFQVNQALTFMAGQRTYAEVAAPGDIIGLHNHGTIQIGDTFTEGESLQFIGIPNFAPELFKRIQLEDPFKTKSITKGFNSTLRRRRNTSF